MFVKFERLSRNYSETPVMSRTGEMGYLSFRYMNLLPAYVSGFLHTEPAQTRRDPLQLVSLHVAAGN